MFGLLNCLLVGLTALGIALVIHGTKLRWSPPPRPAGWEAPQRVSPGSRAPGRHSATRSLVIRRLTAPRLATTGHSSSRSLPVTIVIPAIHVRARVIPLGLTRDGSLAAPPLSHPFLTGWYDGGPTPGQPGAAVIVGHVDAASVGPAVFYDLGRVRPGQHIYITLADRRTAAFVVSAAALYPKASFPAPAVYAPTRLPTLRLITCGGSFDSRTGHYLGSVVVYARYAGQSAAGRVAGQPAAHSRG